MARKVDVRLPVKGNSNSHGAGPVHLIITMIKRVRTSRLLIKNSLCWQVRTLELAVTGLSFGLDSSLHHFEEDVHSDRILRMVFFFFITLHPRVE